MNKQKLYKKIYLTGKCNVDYFSLKSWVSLFISKFLWLQMNKFYINLLNMYFYFYELFLPSVIFISGVCFSVSLSVFIMHNDLFCFIDVISHFCFCFMLFMIVFKLHWKLCFSLSIPSIFYTYSPLPNMRYLPNSCLHPLKFCNQFWIYFGGYCEAGIWECILK